MITSLMNIESLAYSYFVCLHAVLLSAHDECLLACAVMFVLVH